MSRFELEDVPVFADIEDVDGVQRLVNELRENARKGSNAASASVAGPLSYPKEQ